MKEAVRFPMAGVFSPPSTSRRQRACRGRELETAIDPGHRVLVYFGFVDTKPGFDDLLLEQLSRLGTVTALRHFPGASRAAVIDPVIPEWIESCSGRTRGKTRARG